MLLESWAGGCLLAAKAGGVSALRVICCRRRPVWVGVVVVKKVMGGQVQLIAFVARFGW